MFGSAAIDFVAADETIPFVLKNTDPGGDPSVKAQISLLDLAKSTTPPCSLNPLLFNGHLHTAYAGTRGTEDVEIHYKRRVWESDNVAYPGQFTVDFVIDRPEPPLERDRSLPPRTHNFSEQEFADLQAADDESPMLVVLHGLSGGSHEQYLRHALRPLVYGKGGWSACVVNARGCSWSKVTTPWMFNARATWDIRQVVKWLRKTWPRRRLYAVGYSLGANILCNYLGEEGENCKIEAAVLVCNPWNLDVANTLLRTTWIGENIYLARMGQWMKKLFERQIDVLSKNPDIDVDKVLNSNYLYEWDRYVQCPSWGYPTEHAYYRDASSVDAALNIRIPVLALHARDDPIISDLAVPYDGFKLTPYVVLCTTTSGGHIGWFELGGDRWYTKTVSAAIRGHGPPNSVQIAGFLQKINSETEGPLAVKSANGHKKDADTKSTFDTIGRRMQIHQ
jgi:hypothetical protein